MVPLPVNLTMTCPHKNNPHKRGDGCENPLLALFIDPIPDVSEINFHEDDVGRGIF